jgi:hypothetical protein
VEAEPPSQSSPTGPTAGVNPKEGFGCFALVVVALICGAAGTMFQGAGAGGAIWAGLGVCALAAMGFGIVYLGVKYHS